MLEVEDLFQWKESCSVMNTGRYRGDLGNGQNRR